MEEVCCWDDWVLQRGRAEIGGLCPRIPDAPFKGGRWAIEWESGEWLVSCRARLCQSPAIPAPVPG